MVKVNQIGYPSDAPKVAVLTDGQNPFYICCDQSGTVVFEGKPKQPIKDQASGELVFHGDFSSLTTEGSYYIKQGTSQSAPFQITRFPYQAVHLSVLKAFYYLRCGMALSPPYAETQWVHKACHTQVAIDYESKQQIKCQGGWHDAGDYGKYTVAAAKALADLLLAFELKPATFQATTPIPETDGVMPDLLHECQYELNWLLKMQNKGSGGVYHKVTTLAFPAMIMPEDDVEPLYVLPISTTATAAFTAIMAQAYRILLNYQPDSAKNYLTAAKQAWAFLMKHPEPILFVNPNDVLTGEYGDNCDRDERYWAAGELYRATGDGQYVAAFKVQSDHKFDHYALGWANMGGYGTISYLLNQAVPTEDALGQLLRAGWLNEAQRLLKVAATTGYRVSLEVADYHWGSNMTLMNAATHLLIAYHLTGEQCYREQALEHVHYLLGRNMHNLSYVSGIGAQSVSQQHYRPSAALPAGSDPVPGLVSGGPNQQLQDEVSRRQLAGKPPQACFIDHEASYATNEVTIYWNSPVVLVLSFFS
ncbi:non-processive endocellulase [Amphibacillus marinus]|uniref:Endoglucanase n=1 Tax=Amphibacillus marinus TaxID=872970 RepID=A0A1H8MMA0_9BACI|nr:glycoside hydrolase family 9 protein [Amphibacillus marinus]SEO18423.1 non-processive endocellulase [Amphibacillus marinus]SEO95239.1 non-processive endocellulase [Amphibacillus marinus]